MKEVFTLNTSLAETVSYLFTRRDDCDHWSRAPSKRTPHAARPG
jgi:hypothetical protein